MYPRPGGGRDTAGYQFSDDLHIPTQLARCQLFIADKKIFYSKNPHYEKKEDLEFSSITAQWLKTKTRDLSFFSACEAALNKYINPHFKNKPLSQIKPSDIQELMEKISHHSYSHQRALLQAIKSVFNYMVLNEFIDRSPCMGMARLKNTKPREYQILSLDELGSLIQIPKINNGRLYKFDSELLMHWRRTTLPMIYQMAAFTGMRPSELFGLQDSCIDFNQKTVTVKQVIFHFANGRQKKIIGVSPNTKWIIKPMTKTDSGRRVIPLMPGLIAALQIFLIERKDNPHGFLFAGPRGDRDPLDPRIFKEYNFTRDLKRAGCPNIRFYDMRHTFCSLVVNSIKKAGGGSFDPADLQKLQYLMGHKKLTTTLNIYTHLFPTNNVDISNQMQALIDTRVELLSTDLQKKAENLGKAWK